MVGILYFLIFLFLGCAITNRIFWEHELSVRIWSGLIVGIIGLMWSVVPFAFFFRFSVISHVLAVVFMIIIFIIVRFIYKDRGSLKLHKENLDLIMLIVVIPIFLISAIILTNHVLVPGPDGSIYCGQSTYGDLSLHLGITTSIATQGFFPPQYSIFPGKLLSYPFLVDSLSSSLYLLGSSLRVAILLPSYFMLLLLVMGFFIFSYEILKHKIAAVLSVILFFFNGGFGFAYFMDGLSKDSNNFTRMFSAFYNTPTNYNEHNIRWSNTICDMILPQRTTMAGWMVVIFGFWILYQAVKNNNRKYYVYAGITAGLLPMIHTHSFLGFGIVAFTWFIVYFFQNKDKKAYILNWIYFAIPVFIFALPQLIFWTFRQSTEGHFLSLQFGWGANLNDIWPWFWIKNVGLVFILLIPALLRANRRTISIYSGAALIFIVAEFILFQPNSYDNNKLFYIWYMFTVILVSDYMISFSKRLKGIGEKGFLIGLVIFICTFSGILTMGREAVSSIMLYDKAAVQAANFVKVNTTKDALFISDNNHNNAIAALAGRSIYAGTPLFLYFHGINSDYRYKEVEEMYTKPKAFSVLAAKDKIDYVYYSNYERNKFKVEPKFFIDNYPIVFHKEDVIIFAISKRAKEQNVKYLQNN
jgi:hypothetical protein